MVGVLDLAGYVQKQGEMGRARGQESFLNRLAGQAYSAAPEQRTEILSQMATASPQAAQAQQQQFRTGDADRVSQLSQRAKLFVSMVKAGNQEAAAGMYPDIARGAKEAFGINVSEIYDPRFLPGLEQLGNMGAGQAGDVIQSQKISDDGYIVNTYRNGRMEKTGQRVDRQAWFRDHAGMPPEIVGKDGTVTQVGQGQPPVPQPQYPQFTGPDGMPIVIDPSLPQHVQDQIRNNPGAFNVAPDGSSAQLPPAQQQFPQRSAATARPSEAQTAAEVAAAKAQVELGYLPQTEAIKRDAAIQQAVGIETGKNAAEKAAAAPATIATLQTSLDSIDALLNSPDLESIVGIGSLNPLNRIPGTNARGLIARADQIAGQAFLAAFNQLKGGGAITEREGQAATAAMARLDRSQNLADYTAALKDLKSAIEPAIARASQQQAAPPSAPAATGGWGIQKVD